MNRDLKSIVSILLNTAPPIFLMRGHPEFQNWAQSLRALGQLERLSPLRETLNAIADNALANNDPINHFLEGEPQRIPFYVYLEASMTAERTVTQNPYAAFILSVVSLLGWAQAGGENLYNQKMYYPGIPYDVDGVYYDDPRLIPRERMRFFGGWDHIPHACGFISLKIGAFEGARQLVEHCYDVFIDALETRNRLSVYPLLDCYRELAKQIQDKYSWAIADLADAFYEEGCHPDRPNFRAEIGAILWTLGLVPESQIFRSTAQPAIIPSKRFFQRLIRQSLDSIPYDSLLQYIWLEMKDRPPFSIREHTSLFNIINAVYAQFPFDVEPFVYAFPLPPSRAFARTLIHWFRGTFNQEVADMYFSVIDLLRQLPAFDDRYLVQSRMASLGYMLTKEFDWLSPAAASGQDEVTIWKHMNNNDASLRRAIDLYPEVPDPQNRMNVPLFHLIESMFSHLPDTSPLERAQFENLLDATEANRISRLSYWLQIAPPLPSTDEQAKVGEFLAKEGQLLEYLRGAYLLTHYNSLPRYFGRPTLEFDDLEKIESDPEKFALTPENGRKQYQKLETELTALSRQMQEAAPDYARKRLQPQATLDDLLNALSSHSMPPKEAS